MEKKNSIKYIPHIYKLANIKNINLCTLNTSKTLNTVKFDLWDNDNDDKIVQRQIFIRINNINIAFSNSEHIGLCVSEKQDMLMKEFEQQLMKFISTHLFKYVKTGEKITYARMCDSNTRIIGFDRNNVDYPSLFYINKKLSDLDCLTNDDICDIIIEITEIVFDKNLGELHIHPILRQIRQKKIEPKKICLVEYSFSEDNCDDNNDNNDNNDNIDEIYNTDNIDNIDNRDTTNQPTDSNKMDSDSSNDSDDSHNSHNSHNSDSNDSDDTSDTSTDSDE